MNYSVALDPQTGYKSSDIQIVTYASQGLSRNQPRDAVKEYSMRRRQSLLSLLCIVLFLQLSGVALAAEPEISPEDIPTMDSGELLALVAEEKGKVIVINIFASWCPPCRDEIPVLVNLRRQYPEDSLLLVGVSVDREPKALANYMGEMRMNYPVYLAKGDFMRRVGVKAVPQLLIYGKSGKLEVNHVGLADEGDLKTNLKEFLEAE
jgi:thiol-disulfide isomerase/thioredoxin